MPYADANGLSQHYIDVGSGGPPIVLLHELGGSSESFAAMAAMLLSHRRVIAVDLRGAGRSEKPPGPFETADQADDVAALLRVLGIASADVIGSALGSLVGALLAIRHPTRVRRLMMAAVAPDMAGATANYLAARAARVRVEGMRAVADASLANSFPSPHEAVRAAYRPIYLGNDPAAYAEMSLALARLTMRQEDWAAIRCPVLVASGETDFLWPPAVGQLVADAIPDARFTVLQGAGHFPHLQTPGLFARMALAFFG